jgi:hypothetical protein
MPYQPIPPAIAQADIDNLKSLVQDLRDAIAALNTNSIGLTKDERKNGVTIGPKRKPFNDYYYGNKNSYPNLKPGQQAITELSAEKHFFVQNGMNEVCGLILTAFEEAQDVSLNSEHYAHDYASAGRKSAKEGKINGLPGADSFFDALDALYPQSSGPDPGNP